MTGSEKNDRVSTSAMAIITGFALSLVGVAMTKDGTTVEALEYMGSGAFVMISPMLFDWMIRKFFNR